MNIIYSCFSLFLILSCGSNEVTTPTPSPIMITQDDNLPKITAVECAGQPNNYTLSVTIESPDTGCDQYADWWEVFYPDGTLIYRRILGHSHVTEQPFTRSGGVVNVGPVSYTHLTLPTIYAV